MRLANIFIIGCMTFFLSSCYEDQEGCLDIRSSNFDLEADVACDNCCEYPSIKLQFKHQKVLADTSYSIQFGDSIYYDAAAQPYRLERIKYYVSNIKVETAAGDFIQVTNEINIPVFANSETIDSTFKDDFIIVNGASTSSLGVGNYIAEKEQIIRLHFDLGLDPIINTTNPESLSGHPLAYTSDTLYDAANGRYLFSKIAWYEGISEADSIPVQLSISAFETPISLSFDITGPVFFPLGEDITFVLQVNVPLWFSQSNILTDSNTKLTDDIMEGFSNSIDLIGVQ